MPQKQNFALIARKKCSEWPPHSPLLSLLTSTTRSGHSGQPYLTIIFFFRLHHVCLGILDKHLALKCNIMLLYQHHTFFPYLHPGLVRVCSLVLFFELYFKGFYKSSENAEDKDMGCTGQMGKLQRVDVTVLWSPKWCKSSQTGKTSFKSILKTFRLLQCNCNANWNAMYLLSCLL